jgi:hypothetical protein
MAAAVTLAVALPAQATSPAKTPGVVGPAVTAAGNSAPGTSVPGWLNSVAAVSASDVWAVGISGLSGGLIFHWNGKRWYHINPAGYFNGVAARTSADVWAVGATSQGPGAQTIVKHWNGRSWTRVPTPTLSGGGYFNAVAATSAGNVWAVGQSGGGNSTNPAQPLIEHWNGRHWTVQRFPSPPGGGQFRSVAALSASNAWAVGAAGSQTLVAHWNGLKWSRWASPNVSGATDSELIGVTMIAPDNAWAVGNGNMPDNSSRTLTAHWNGHHWLLVPSPNRAGTAALFSVTAAGTNNIWAVGTAYGTPGCYGESCGPYLTLVMHWTGTRWTTVPSPNPAETINITLNGVAAVTAGNIWAVGNANASSTLILHWNGKAWSD